MACSVSIDISSSGSSTEKSSRPTACFGGLLWLFFVAGPLLLFKKETGDNNCRLLRIRAASGGKRSCIRSNR